MHRTRAPYLFLMPAIIFFTCISIIPMLYALGLGFFEEAGGAFHACGLANFTELAGDAVFGRALLNTFLYALITIPVGLALALFFAVLLNAGIRGRSFFRAIYFTPAVTTAAAIGYIWLWLYDPHKGVLNQMVLALGGDPLTFLDDTATALVSIAAVRVWTFLGFQTVIFLAGLQAIPYHLYEAARVEGANAWQRFRYITLPLLNPTILFLTVMGTIKTLQMFTEIYIMTDDGGPLHSTASIVYVIQKTAFDSSRKGYAAAMTVVLFTLILGITLFQIKFVRRRVDY